MLALALVGGALAALCSLGILVALVRRYPFLGVAFCAIVVLPKWELPSLPALANIGGYSLYPADVITLMLGVVGVLEFRRMRIVLRGWFLAWGVIGALILLSLARGVTEYGLATAVNAARAEIWLFLATSWAISVDWRRVSLRGAGLAIGWALTIVAAVHLATYGFGSVGIYDIAEDGTYRSTRLLTADQSMMLALCAGAVLFDRERAHRFANRLSALAFFLIVLLAQNRSVWIAVAGALVAVAIFSTRSATRVRVLAYIGAASLAGAIALGLGGLGDVGAALTRSATDFDTWQWRLAGWAELVPKAFSSGPLDALFGNPTGDALSRLDPSGMRLLTVSSHNWYVDTLVGVGLIGVGIWVALVIRGLVHARHGNGTLLFTGAALLIYGVPYALDWTLAPWLGAVIASSVASTSGEQSIHPDSQRSSSPPGLNRPVSLRALDPVPPPEPPQQAG